MESINKELLGELLKLEENQQEKVLEYIKGLLSKEGMIKRVELSEKEIAEGNTISSEQFNNEFELWKKGKRESIK